MIELFNESKFESYKKSVDDKSNVFETSRELIKESTKFKKTDLNKAIELIKKSIIMIDEVVLDDYFKLSNYYHLANDPKAFEVLAKLKHFFDKKEYGMYFMKLSLVDEKYCTIAYKDKNYESYIIYYCSWFRNKVIAYACQGRNEPYNGLINNIDKLNFLAPSKVANSLKKIGIDKNQLQNMLDDYFSVIKSKTDIIAELAYKIENSDEYKEEYRINETFGQRADRILGNNNKFINLYSELVNEDFINNLNIKKTFASTIYNK